MSNINYANKGKSLETLIEYANSQYKAKGKALIQKVPTPWTVQRAGGRIISAFPASKSTVDFIGVAGGQGIAFDVKQCKLKTNFPLRNVELHQYEFICNWAKQGGIGFYLIEMTALGKIYRVDHNQMLDYWFTMINGGSKSIPIKDFATFQEVRESKGIVLDYLGVCS